MPEKKRVLVVDDDEKIRDLLCIFSRMLDFACVSAENAENALLQFSKASFDLVVTDFQMPGINGLALSRHIKSAAPDTPIILITGLRDDDFAEGLLRGWVDFILRKPFDMAEFKKAPSHFFGHIHQTGKYSKRTLQVG